MRYEAAWGFLRSPAFLGFANLVSLVALPLSWCNLRWHGCRGKNSGRPRKPRNGECARGLVGTVCWTASRRSSPESADRLPPGCRRTAVPSSSLRGGWADSRVPRRPAASLRGDLDPGASVGSSAQRCAHSRVSPETVRWEGHRDNNLFGLWEFVRGISCGVNGPHFHPSSTCFLVRFPNI